MSICIVHAYALLELLLVLFLNVRATATDANRRLVGSFRCVEGKGAVIGFWVAFLVFWGFGSFSPLLAQAKEQSADVQSITPYLKQFQQKITEFRLDNGIKFIILQNRDAPATSLSLIHTPRHRRSYPLPPTTQPPP